MLKIALIATLATASFSVSAHAAPVCGKRDDVVAQLSEKYKEAPVGVGLASNGGLIELLAASNGTTWTLIVTLANGPTCLVATGHDWQSSQAAVPDGPSI
jgi:hypothetical protein